MDIKSINATANGFSFYEVRVKTTMDDGKKTKKIVETYLIRAMTVTVAEAIIHEEMNYHPCIDHEIQSIKKTKILKVMELDEGNDSED